MNRGNIIVTEHDKHGIVLAVRKDGTRALAYIYGPDREEWMPVEWLTVTVAGLEKCFKCSGSGKYYSGGAVVNGVYTGFTGECYACGGKGQQDDDDRIRCHNYWHRRGADVEDRPLDASPQPQATPTPEQEQMMEQFREPAKPKRKIKSTKQNPAPTRRRKKPVTDDDGAELIDCKGCGTLHREDTMCPW